MSSFKYMPQYSLSMFHIAFTYGFEKLELLKSFKVLPAKKCCLPAIGKNII